MNRVRQHLFLLGFEIQNIGSIRIGHLSLQILGTNAPKQSGYSTSGVSVSCYFYANAIKLGICPLMSQKVEMDSWPTKRRHVQQLSVAEMRMLRWFCGHTRRDRVRNEVIRDRVGVAPIEEKLTQHRLRWFGHVQRRPPEAPVRNGVLERVDNVKRGRCRPKLTWDESVKRDLKDWNISKEIASDRSA